MDEKLDEFYEYISAIAGLSKRSDLIRRPGWGDINFAEAETDINTVIRMAQDLCSLPAKLLPDSVLTTGTDAGKRMCSALKPLLHFSITAGGELTQIHDTIVSGIHRAAENFSQSIGLWIPYLAYHRGDAEENIKKLTAMIGDAEQKTAEFFGILAAKNAEAEKLIENIKSASAEAGVAVYAQDFQQESEANDKTARRWLWGAGVMTALTMGFLVLFYFWKIEADTLVHMLPQLGCRVLAITLLFAVTFWCGRMYKAMRNQAIQNRHRALGLKTFRAFADAASNAETKDAVLRETTHAIFSATPTGLVNEGAASDVDPSIVQIAGGMLGPVSGK